MENADLKALERKVYLSFSEDGYYDIIAGFVITAIGFQELFLKSIIPIIIIIMVPFLILGKRRVTYSRMGHVKFGLKRNRTVFTWRITVFLLLIACVIATMFGWLVPGNGAPAFYKWFWTNLLFVGGVLVAFGVLIAAIVTGIKRFYAYAVLAWLIYGIGFGFGLPTWTYILCMGLIVLVCGIVLLIRFLTKYPAIPEKTFTEGGTDASA